MMRDADFGMVRLRAFGIYSIRVEDPSAFIKEIAGTNAHFVTEDIEGQLKRTLVSGFSDALGESKIAALDLASNYDELSKFTRIEVERRVQDLWTWLDEVCGGEHFASGRSRSGHGQADFDGCYWRRGASMRSFRRPTPCGMPPRILLAAERPREPDWEQDLRLGTRWPEP